jgi:hypothetical protein
MTATFTQDYDPGFLNVPGFGQSAQNPLAPVFYQSMGVVQDLTVYQSIYGTQAIHAGEAFILGGSKFTASGFNMQPPGTFQDTVSFSKPVIVEGMTFKPTVINTISGPHLVLAVY